MVCFVSMKTDMKICLMDQKNYVSFILNKIDINTTYNYCYKTNSTLNTLPDDQMTKF